MKIYFIYCVRLFNILASCLPWIPEQGTVGASGDLAPLSHLALGLMGEGHMWSPQTGWGDASYVNINLRKKFRYNKKFISIVTLLK